MSLATWKAEFYPKPVERVAKKNAVAHSIQKWRGLTKTGMKKHGVVGPVDGGFIEDASGNRFFIGGDSCALCHHYLDLDSARDVCAPCPLAISRDGVACSSRRTGETTSPWDAFADGGDARPMLRALRRIATVPRSSQ